MRCQVGGCNKEATVLYKVLRPVPNRLYGITREWTVVCAYCSDTYHRAYTVETRGWRGKAQPASFKLEAKFRVVNETLKEGRGKYMGKNPWAQTWDVTGSSGDTYRVGQRASGEFGCSCPGWKFKKAPKPDCKHIRAIKEALKCVPAVPKEYNLQEEARRSVLEKTFTGKFLKYSCVLCQEKFDTRGALELHTSWVHSKPVQAPPQAVEVEGDKFNVVRKFRFATAE